MGGGDTPNYLITLIFSIVVEDATSPDQSPPLLPSPPRDKLFLEANYRSLERVSDEDDMRKLGAVSSRASISAKFFRKQSIL